MPERTKDGFGFETTSAKVTVEELTQQVAQLTEKIKDLEQAIQFHVGGAWGSTSYESPHTGMRAVTIYTKAGVPSDQDYVSPPANGTMILDTTNNRIYFRTSTSTWKYAALT